MSTPASRLHDLLSLAASSRSGSPAIEAWASIFQVVATASPNFFTRVAELATLAADVQELVEALPDTEAPDLILRHYVEVDRTIANFARVANLNMQQFMEPLERPGLLSVEMADRALRRTGYRESRLEQSELDTLRTEAQDLIANVVGAAGLTPEQKRPIVAHLRAVEDTLINVMLSDDDVIRANNGLVGSILAPPRRAWDSHAIRRLPSLPQRSRRPWLSTSQHRKRKTRSSRRSPSPSFSSSGSRVATISRPSRQVSLTAKS
jgi:hypothetical protein